MKDKTDKEFKATSHFEYLIFHQHKNLRSNKKHFKSIESTNFKMESILQKLKQIENFALLRKLAYVKY